MYEHKIRPKQLNFNHMGYVNVSLNLKKRFTVLNGNSATGKSYLFRVIKKYKNEHKNENILCINMDSIMNMEEDYLLSILNDKKDCIIVIDNADKVLYTRRKINEFILTDKNNYYILMGRGINCTSDEWAAVIATKDS